MTRQQISKAIALARRRQKKTPYKVCKATNLATHQYRHLEEGSVNYTIDTLLKACEALGLEITIEPVL